MTEVHGGDIDPDGIGDGECCASCLHHYDREGDEVKCKIYSGRKLKLWWACMFDYINRWENERD